MPEFVTLTADNLDDHHLCCAMATPRHVPGVQLKRDWLRARIAEGLVFRKLDVQGKVFIEYAPAEVAWRPIVAPGWLVIHCLWVSGRFQEQGHGRALLQHCLDDARRRGSAGVVVATGRRKRPFLGDPKFFAHHGFEVVQRVGDFQLMAHRVAHTAPDPRFSDSVTDRTPSADGPFTIAWTPQCPFGPACAQDTADALDDLGHRGEIRAIDTLEEAQRVASPLGAFGVEREGALVMHHPNTAKGVARALAKLD